MTIQRDIEPDLRDPAVCDFLRDLHAQTYSHKAATIAGLIADGYVPSAKADRAFGQQRIALRTFSEKRFELLSPAGRLIQESHVVDPIDHGLEIRLWATLLLKDPANANSAAIETAFETTAIDPDAIDAVELDLGKAGVGASSFQIVLFFELNRTGFPEILSINATAYREQVSQLLDAAGKPAYIVKEDETFWHLCDTPDTSFDDGDVIIVPDVDNPTQEISDAENEQHRECEGLEVTDHRIGTAFQYYEWKTEWEVRDIRIGRCRIMRTKIPIIYSRIRKQALWCYAMTQPQVKRNVEKGIITCLEIAAVNTAVLAIVTGGLGLTAAAAAFGASCLTCLETKVSDAVNCFFTSLKLVAEKGEWEEKVF